MPHAPTAAEDHALIATLIRLGVDSTWEPIHRLDVALRIVDEGEDPAEVGRDTHHRAATVTAWADTYRSEGRSAFLPMPAASPRPGAPSLRGFLAGRLVEETLFRQTQAALTGALDVRDAREQDPDPGWDFEIAAPSGGAAGGFTVDVKLHSEPFREAAKYAHLDPDDCVPLGIYKMLVSRERQVRGGSHHVYVFLFRPQLAENLETLLRTLLSQNEGNALDTLFGTTAKGTKRQERRAAATVVDRRFPQLANLVQGYEFRAISTRRASNLFLELVETRAPMLRGSGRGFGSTINMHYSWSREMTPWATVLQRASQSLPDLLNDFAQGRI